MIEEHVTGLVTAAVTWDNEQHFVHTVIRPN